MHPALNPLFDEHRDPTHCDWKAAYAESGPFLKLAAKAQQQTALYRELLLHVEHEAQDPALNGRIEAIHGKLLTIDKSMPELIRRGRAMTKAFQELDAEIAEAKQIIMARDAGAITTTIVAAPGVATTAMPTEVASA